MTDDRYSSVPAERIYAGLEQCSYPSSGCWEWGGALDQHGYGTFRSRGVGYKAHRAVYALLVEPPDPTLDLDHLCRNRKCVNPAHLEPVSRRENVLRGNTIAAMHAAKTHCIHGHEFTPENTYRIGVWRKCKKCRARVSAEHRDRVKALMVVPVEAEGLAA